MATAPSELIGKRLSTLQTFGWFVELSISQVIFNAGLIGHAPKPSDFNQAISLTWRDWIQYCMDNDGWLTCEESELRGWAETQLGLTKGDGIGSD